MGNHFQQGNQVNAGIVRRKAAQGLVAAFKQFASTVVLGERKLVVASGNLDQSLVELLLFSDNVVPRFLPEFVRLEEMTVVELFYALVEEGIGHNQSQTGQELVSGQSKTNLKSIRNKYQTSFDML
jgi:hypothetical protein